MNDLVGNKTAVLDSLQQTIDAFKADGPIVQNTMNASLHPSSEAERQAMRAQIIQQLQDAYTIESHTQETQPWYAPQNSTIALVQSAMQQHMGPDIGSTQRRAMVDSAGVPIPERFGDTDPGWIECVVDMLSTTFEGKAQFTTHAALSDFMFKIEDQCKVALVADWGADNDPAIHVRDQIVAKAPDYVIHLGDIYYAGQDNEVKSFLSHWPSAKQKRSFGLNGNHEMYTGGHSYFGRLLPAFAQPASYFGLSNSNWQLLALDTAFVDHCITSPKDARLEKQMEWVTDKLKDATHLSILLTHHQPFSAFQPEHDAAVRLRQDISRIYQATNNEDCIFGWFFGHEHRCTIYDDSFSPYKARLIGHGCIPHLPPAFPQNPPVPFTSMNRITRPDGSGYAISGFALLTFDGPVIQIEYVNEDGSIWSMESWTAPPARARVAAATGGPAAPGS